MAACTIENAENVFSCVESVITELYKKAGLGEHPFIDYQVSVYSRA